MLFFPGSFLANPRSLSTGNYVRPHRLGHGSISPSSHIVPGNQEVVLSDGKTVRLLEVSQKASTKTEKNL